MINDDVDEVLWSEIFAALPPRLRRALIRRLVVRRESPPPLAPWLARASRLAERDELVRVVHEWALPGVAARPAARLIARWLARAVTRRAPLEDPAGRIVRLNNGRALKESSIRAILAKKN